MSNERSLSARGHGEVWNLVEYRISIEGPVAWASASALDSTHCIRRWTRIVTLLPRTFFERSYMRGVGVPDTTRAETDVDKCVVHLQFGLCINSHRTRPTAQVCAGIALGGGSISAINHCHALRSPTFKLHCIFVFSSAASK